MKQNVQRVTIVATKLCDLGGDKKITSLGIRDLTWKSVVDLWYIVWFIVLNTTFNNISVL